jgi:hypothetical protein
MSAEVAERYDFPEADAFTGEEEPERNPIIGNMDARQLVLSSYDLPKVFYGSPHRIISGHAAAQMSQLGLMIWYADECNHTGRSRRTPMDVDGMVAKWKTLIVGLSLAHDKDEADRIEASVEECLSPILAAPIKQVRTFAAKLMEALKADPKVPFLVWRPYEIWVSQMKDAPDGDVKELKTDLAKQIVDLVEKDVASQLPDAMVRALQWRSAAALEEMKGAVEKEHAKGGKARLTGKESCLFLSVVGNGTEDEPQYCVQV